MEKGRRGRIRKQLPDDFKGKIGRWKLKKDALYGTLGLEGVMGCCETDCGWMMNSSR
jgi:hypothetical protein